MSRIYKDENGEVVQGDVSTSALIAMLKLQSDISEGIAEHVDTSKWQKFRAKYNAW